MYSWGHFNLQYNDQAIQPIGEAVSNTELFRRLAQKWAFNTVCDIEDEEIMRLALDWDHTHLDGINIDLLKERCAAKCWNFQTRKPHADYVFQPSQENLNLLAQISTMVVRYLIAIDKK